MKVRLVETELRKHIRYLSIEAHLSFHGDIRVSYYGRSITRADDSEKAAGSKFIEMIPLPLECDTLSVSSCRSNLATPPIAPAAALHVTQPQRQQQQQQDLSSTTLGADSGDTSPDTVTIAISSTAGLVNQHHNLGLLRSSSIVDDSLRDDFSPYSV